MIQAITMNEQTYDSAKEHIDFIKKYVFPGVVYLLFFAWVKVLLNKLIYNG